MRMDRSSGCTAADLIDSLSRHQLQQVSLSLLLFLFHNLLFQGIFF